MLATDAYYSFELYSFFSYLFWNWIIQRRSTFTFTFMHSADAFIQSDLQCIQAIQLYICHQYMCSLGIKPTHFVLMLMQSSTTGTLSHLSRFQSFIVHLNHIRTL